MNWHTALIIRFTLSLGKHLAYLHENKRFLYREIRSFFKKIGNVQVTFTSRQNRIFNVFFVPLMKIPSPFTVLLDIADNAILKFPNNDRK